jgi:2,4-dienoyl-CoA reductase-like NADH-dependent reductase (Old Yellow Enzyme family)
MSRVFETSNISGMSLKNRIIRSATGDGLADPDGRPTAKLIEFYEKLAAGGAGAIITGLTGYTAGWQKQHLPSSDAGQG